MLEEVTDEADSPAGTLGAVVSGEVTGLTVTLASADVALAPPLSVATAFTA